MKKSLFIVVFLLSTIFTLTGCGGSSGGGNTPIAPGAPGAPTLITADSQLTVNWTSVTGATSYEVWYHTADISGAATKFTGDNNDTDTICIITGLTNDTPYYVWVKAKNSAGSSGFSPSASRTPSSPINVTLYSSATLDGRIMRSMSASESYNLDSPNVEMAIGNSPSAPIHNPHRGFLSFNLNSIPAGATIQSATLRVYKLSNSFSTNLYTKLGNLLADHVTYGAIFDSAHAQSIYNTALLDTFSTPLSTNTALGWKEVVVTAPVQADLTAGRDNSQFRLRHEREIPLDSLDYTSYFEFWSTGNSASNKPELVITYVK